MVCRRFVGSMVYLEAVHTCFWLITLILWCKAFVNRLGMLLAALQPVFVRATALRGQEARPSGGGPPSRWFHLIRMWPRRWYPSLDVGDLAETYELLHVMPLP